MQTGRMVQVVVLITIVVMGAGCAASKEYTSKLFAPRVPVEKDSQAVALRFLELDNLEPDQDNWVTTDIIMGRDTVSKTLALDKFSNVFPASSTNSDTTIKTEQPKAMTIMAEAKPVQEEKPIPAAAAPVAKAANPGEVREKRVRE